MRPTGSAKSCGDCNLCCKVVAVTSLNKPAGRWCEHARTGRGCAIYGDHPEDCKSFNCGWLELAELGDDWKPNRCKFVLRGELGGQRLCVDVDPAYPNSWKDPRFYGRIKKFSEAIWTQAGQVIVYVGTRAIAVFPEEDVPIGEFVAGDTVQIGYNRTDAWRQPAVRLASAAGDEREILGAVYANPQR